MPSTLRTLFFQKFTNTWISSKGNGQRINGDRGALQLLLKDEKEKLYRVAFTYVRNEDDAVDVFQQTILLAIESIHQLKEPN
jgi:RNA polymerase sigma-70 factor (ECF subfamily)